MADARTTIESTIKRLDVEAKNISKNATCISDVIYWENNWLGDPEERKRTGVYGGVLGNIYRFWSYGVPRPQQKSEKELNAFADRVAKTIERTKNEVIDKFNKELFKKIDNYKKILDTRTQQEIALQNNYIKNESKLSDEEKRLSKEFIEKVNKDTDSLKRLINSLGDATFATTVTDTQVSDIEKTLKEIKNNDARLEKETGIKGYSPTQEFIGQLQKALDNYLSNQREDIKKHKVLQGKGVLDFKNISGRAGEKTGKFLQKLLGGKGLENRHENLIASIVANFEENLPDDIDGKEQQKKVKEFEKELRDFVVKQKGGAFNEYLGKKELSNIKNFAEKKMGISETPESETEAKPKKPETPEILEAKPKSPPPGFINLEEETDFDAEQAPSNIINKHAKNITGKKEFELGAKTPVEERNIYTAITETPKIIKSLYDVVKQFFRFEEEKHEDELSESEKEKTMFSKSQGNFFDKKGEGGIDEFDSEAGDGNNGGGWGFGKSWLTWQVGKYIKRKFFTKAAEEITKEITKETVKKGIWETVKRATGEFFKQGAKSAAIMDALGISGTGAAVALAGKISTEKANESAKFQNTQYLKEAEQRGYNKATLITKGFSSMKWKNQRLALYAMKKADAFLSTGSKESKKDFIQYYVQLKEEDPDIANLIYSMITSDNKWTSMGYKPIELKNEDGSVYNYEQNKPKLMTETPALVKFDTKARSAWKSLTNSFNFGGDDIESENPTINPKINDGFISKNGSVTPIDDGDALMVGKDLDSKKSLTEAIKEGFHSILSQKQDLFNPKTASNDTLSLFEKVITPIQEHLTKKKEEKMTAINQTFVSGNQQTQQPTIKKIPIPTELDFVRY